METLLQDPYNFKQGDNVVARVTCANVVGEGPKSSLSSLMFESTRSITSLLSSSSKILKKYGKTI